VGDGPMYFGQYCDDIEAILAESHGVTLAQVEDREPWEEAAYEVCIWGWQTGATSTQTVDHLISMAGLV